VSALTVEIFSVVTVLVWFQCILKGIVKDWVIVGTNALAWSGFALYISNSSGGFVVMEVTPTEIFSHSPSMPSFSFARDDESAVHDSGNYREGDTSALASFGSLVSDSSLGRFGVLSRTLQRSMLWCNSEARD
jgi:hypothetical protein